jgi:hypothetical protein
MAIVNFNNQTHFIDPTKVDQPNNLAIVIFTIFSLGFYLVYQSAQLDKALKGDRIAEAKEHIGKGGLFLYSITKEKIDSLSIPAVRLLIAASGINLQKTSSYQDPSTLSKKAIAILHLRDDEAVKKLQTALPYDIYPATLSYPENDSEVYPSCSSKEVRKIDWLKTEQLVKNLRRPSSRTHTHFRAVD